MSPDRPTPVALEVERDSDLWSVLPEAEAIIAKAVSAAFAEAGLLARPDAELAVTLADDARVRSLNAEWRAKDRPTNVLTFPAVEPDETAEAPMLGDVILAFETVAREARDEQKTLGDHVAHLTIHGVLHLFGFDHLEDDEADAMEAIEIRALARIGVADPYAAIVETPTNS
ncbi:rRNA maturation RNase YbeY [Hansschlegelia beijingensis]|uniref:Endoribonuclease YbeY n=1 Tax=Hansschlegelia beijingensis TaxID=1133344 RepID=A0A7W6CY37_9HYPH|nr:rRNA maturation RNase YbeY [Hansschlegelia beijingensis]MBB3973206.1 putative rRNA maturation factor [Hansschlegelia beijingensis]